MLVMKFGGTSVGNGERILQVARIAMAEREQEPIIVTSAMTGVTDTLIKLHATAASGDEDGYGTQFYALKDRHLEAARTINAAADWSYLEERLTDLATRLDMVFLARDASLQARDSIVCFGEILAVILVAGAVDAVGGIGGCYDAPVIVTDDHFGEATPLAEPTRILAHRCLADARAGDALLVAPGYIGRVDGSLDGQEVMTTLGRGGSDYTATLLAVALDAPMCWIYTDVDGVYTTDPRIVREARILPSISYDSAGRLAVCGAKVLHPRSVAPAARRHIELRVRNTFKPDHPGTLITEMDTSRINQPQAIAGRRKLCAIGLEGPGLPEIVNLFGRMSRAIANAGVEIISAAHPVLGYDPQVIIDATAQDEVARALEDEFAAEMAEGGLITAIEITQGLALCTLVGDEMRRLVLEQAQRALAADSIVPRGVLASLAAISFIVTEEELDRAIRRLHADVIEPALREAQRQGTRPYPSGQWVAGSKVNRQRIISPQH